MSMIEMQKKPAARGGLIFRNRDSKASVIADRESAEEERAVQKVGAETTVYMRMQSNERSRFCCRCAGAGGH